MSILDQEKQMEDIPHAVYEVDERLKRLETMCAGQQEIIKTCEYEIENLKHSIHLLSEELAHTKYLAEHYDSSQTTKIFCGSEANLKINLDDCRTDKSEDWNWKSNINVITDGPGR